AAVIGLTRSRYGFEYLPDAVDVIKLPELDARQPPELMARRIRGAVSELGPERLARLRRSIVDAFMDVYDPAAFVVDYHPFGRDGELRDAIRGYRDCRWVLGLRGIVQSPERTALSHFGETAAAEIAELYSTVCVYADRRVVDLEEIYDVPEAVAAMLNYTGYVTRAAGEVTRPAEADELDRPLSVIAFGGGNRMDRLLEAAADAALDAARGTVVVFAGPWADARSLAGLERSAATSGRLRLVSGSRHLDSWLRAADL